MAEEKRGLGVMVHNDAAGEGHQQLALVWTGGVERRRMTCSLIWGLLGDELKHFVLLLAFTKFHFCPCTHGDSRSDPREAFVLLSLSCPGCTTAVITALRRWESLGKEDGVDEDGTA